MKCARTACQNEIQPERMFVHRHLHRLYCGRCRRWINEENHEELIVSVDSLLHSHNENLNALLAVARAAKNYRNAKRAYNPFDDCDTAKKRMNELQACEDALFVSVENLPPQLKAEIEK